jgi:hypothetical protein
MNTPLNTLWISIFVLTATLVSPPEAIAFGGAPGGPFSNGSYFSNEGTFSAVIRGENLAGVLQFSTTGGAGPVPLAGQQAIGPFQTYDVAVDALGGLGSTGVATIYYDGDTFAGNSQGAYNPAASTIAVNFQANIAGQGQQDVQILQAVIDPATGLPHNYQATRRYLYFDSVYFNGFAECEASDAFPNQKFAGSGEAELQFLDFSSGTPALVAQRLSLSVTGVRLSNVASSFATRNVTPPSVNSLSVLQQ